MPRPKAPPATLPDRAAEFLRDAADQPKTESTYRTALVCFQRFAEDRKLTPTATPLPPTAWRAETLADFYSWLKAAKYRNASMRLYLLTTRQYAQWLAAGNLLPPPLTDAVLREALEKKTGKRGRRLRPDRRGSDDAIGLLLTYFSDALRQLPTPAPGETNRQRLILLRNHALLHTLYATAGRAGEVASLQRADVAEGRATHFEIVGKGRKRRHLILTTAAQTAIQAYLRERPDSAPGLFVSHGAHKDQPLTPQAIWKIVSDAGKAVFGVDAKGRARKRVGPHAFRHLRAQHLSDEGMSITSLQTLLGHASIATTRDIYAPKTPSDQLLDEVATYSRTPEEVVRRAKQAKSGE